MVPLAEGALSARIEQANTRVLELVQAATPMLVGIAPARDAIPGMGDDVLLHAGPPVAWPDVVEPMRSAIVGALIFEGRARGPEEAVALMDRGLIRLSPAHHLGAVGPMAGIISPSMPVFVVRNTAFGNEAYSTINEGLGKALRFGAFDDAVLARLRWMRDVLAPILADTLALTGPIDLRDMVAEGLRRGDECHNRNKASTAQFLRTVAPAMVRTGRPRDTVAACLEFIASNDHFFLNLSIAHTKAALGPAGHVPHSTVVTAMAANGVHFGIRVAGLGDQWIVAPSEVAQGRWFEGYGEGDAAPAVGDSYISEVLGLGGFAMAAAPAIVSFIGGKPSQAAAFTEEMYRITLAEHPHFRIPALDYRGVPFGIDVRKVVETGIAPVLNTGIAGRRPGTGQIGAGIQRCPLACFSGALERLQSLAGQTASAAKQVQAR